MIVEIGKNAVVTERVGKSGGKFATITGGAFWHKVGSQYPVAIKVPLGDAADAPKLAPGRYELDCEAEMTVDNFGSPALGFGWGRKLRAVSAAKAA